MSNDSDSGSMDDEVSNSSNGSQEKTKKKNQHVCIFFDYDGLKLDSNDMIVEVRSKTSFPPISFRPEWKVGPIKQLKTQKEKDLKRKEYRKLYMKRADVMEKTKIRLQDPEVVKKRKEYAELPRVKEQKKRLSSYSRKIRKELKQNNPALYDAYLKKILAANKTTKNMD